MYIPITTGTLALVTIVMILLRIFWLDVPIRLRSLLIRLSITVIALHFFFEVTKWSTASDRLNILINWLAIAGYELLVLLFSRLSPRWLTTLCAAILLIPLFASSVLQPLASLFQPNSIQSQSLGDHHSYEVVPWANVGGGNAGVDVLIYYRPSLAPFLRRRLQSIPFNNQECNSSAAFAVVDHPLKRVVGRCPNWSPKPAQTLDKVFPLP